MERGAPVAYVALTSLLGFIVPIVSIIVLYILIIRRAVRERVRDRPRVASQAYTDAVLQPSSRFWTELNTSKYVGVLVVLWCIFQGPYLLLSYVEQYRNSDQFDDEIELTYPWQIELSFTWMKLSHPVFLPLITFCWRKEVWQKFKNLILCRKSNLINDSVRHTSPTRRRRPQAPSRQISEAIGRRPPGIKESISTTDINKNDSVPVLFATEDGLHFQSYGNRAMMEDDESPDENSLGELEASKVPTARKCDVFGSQISLKGGNDELDNTSDYNSSGEIDPFSQSNAISVRTEYEQQQRTQIGSLSKSSQGRRSRQNSEGNGEIEGSQKRRRKKKEVSPRDNKNDSGIYSNQDTKEKNRKSKGEMDEVIEDVYEKEREKKVDTKDDSKTEHNRTSSDSGQGSHEGTMSKEGKKRIKSRDNPDEEPNGDDEVFESYPPNELNPNTQVNNKTEQADTNVHNDIENDNVDVEQAPNAKPRKKKRRRRNKTEDENAQIVNRPLPELRSGKNVETEFYHPVHNITDETGEDAEIISELQMHQPPPPRLKPITRKREQVCISITIELIFYVR